MKAIPTISSPHARLLRWRQRSGQYRRRCPRSTEGGFARVPPPLFSPLSGGRAGLTSGAPIPKEGTWGVGVEVWLFILGGAGQLGGDQRPTRLDDDLDRDDGGG